jgi:hypothetical protein
VRTRDQPAPRLDHPFPPRSGGGGQKPEPAASTRFIGKNRRFILGQIPASFFLQISGTFAWKLLDFRPAFPVGHIKTNWWLKITLPGAIEKKRPRLWDRGLPCYGRRSDGNRRHSL